MEKILKVYTTINGISNQPFPSINNQIVINSFSYDVKRMGSAPIINATIHYLSCLDDLWTLNEYVIFNGEKYYIKQTPSSSYSNTDARYKHEAEFRSERAILDNTYFFDVVSDPTNNDKYVSNSSKVTFFGDINEFSTRLNYSLKYSKVGYSVVVDEGISTGSFLMSFEDKFFSEVLQSIFEIYKIPYYFIGKVIHIGFTDNTITTPFKYGVNNALLSINKNNANYKTINRITGIGSSENIPYYYPNDTPNGEVLAIAGETNVSIKTADISIIDKNKFADKVKLGDKIKYEGSLSIPLFSLFLDSDKKVPYTGSYIKQDYYEQDFSDEIVDYRYNYIADVAIFMFLQITYSSKCDIKWNVTAKSDSTSFYKQLILYKDGKQIPYDPNYVFPIGTHLIRLNIKSEIPSHDKLSNLGYMEVMATASISSESPKWKNNNVIIDLNNIGISIAKSPSIGDYFIKKVNENVNNITSATNLMPPIYRETNGAERFYNAKNNTYINPDNGKYYLFENEYIEGNPKEHKILFEYIKPTIENITNLLAERIDIFESFDYDKNDNDEIDKDGKYVHPYFFGKLRKMDGANGFNLFEQSIENGEMTISMTSGKCGACNWVIGVDENQKNAVQVDENGNLLRDENGDIRCGRENKPSEIPQDIQQNTQKNSVWIALKKDFNTFGVIMPNTVNSYKPTAKEDTFVILNINLPKGYITNAEKRLKEEIIKYMAANNSEKFNFSISFSRIFFAENPKILEQLNENARLQIEYNSKLYELYISSYSYKMSEDEPLPQIIVELSDTLTINKGTLQNSIDTVKQDIIGSMSNVDILKQGLKYFVRKDIPDYAKKVRFEEGINFGLNEDYGIDKTGASILLSLLLGKDKKYGIDKNGNAFLDKIESINYNSGALGTGHLLTTNPQTGRSYLEVDEIFVRVKAMFTELEIRKLTYAGGNWIFSAAGMKCIKVEEYDTYYRCYFTSSEGSTAVKNEFRQGDFIKYQDFNISTGINHNVQSRYYWRYCLNAGIDWIDLSKLDSDINSDPPLAGDSMVQLGNRNDVSRQNAIIISAYGEGSPSITQHSGINTYSLNGTEKIRISPTLNKFTGEFYFKSGSNVEEKIDTAQKDATEAQKAIAENAAFVQALSKEIEIVKNQVDGAIETWFYDPVPTLSNLPASKWTTTDLKNQHLGDLYYSKEGKAYRFQMNGSSYVWQILADSDIIKALENAKKAQDTADGKRRVFVLQPTNESIYDIGDLWVNATYGATYKNDLLRCKIAKQAGVSFSITHWDLASKYTDDTKALEAVKAAEAANQSALEAKEAANTVAASVTTLNNYVDGAFKDGVITKTEAQTIATYINTINNNKLSVDNQYSKLYDNVYLTGMAKTNLLSAKTSLDTATNNLLTSINTAINDGNTTLEEKADVDAKFAIYNTANATFSTRVEEANKAIQDKLKTYSNEASFAAAAAQADATNAKEEAAKVDGKVSALNTYVDGAFKDGIIDISEYQAIEKYINSVNESKKGNDATYNKIVVNPYLEGTPKTDLTTKKTLLDTAITNLLVSINTAIADKKTTDAEKADVDAKYTLYSTALANFNTAIETANAAIQTKLKSFSDAASTAASNAQSSANEAISMANGVSALISEMANDNKLTPQEKQYAKQEWDVIVSEKPKNDSAADEYGISKTSYTAAYTGLGAYITPLLTNLNTTSDISGEEFRRKFKEYYDQRTDLLNAISSKSKEIADLAQKTANAAAAEAGNAKTAAAEAKKTADTASSAASAAQSAANAANSLLSDISNDNKFTATEKQETKKEWDIIVSEKPLNNTSAAKFGISTVDYDNSYNALNAYITPLLASLTTTSDISGVIFRNNFKTYYDARTKLLNAISEKAKSLADTAQNKANEAATAAGNAQNKANEAATAAGNAQSTANDALSKANGANALLADIASDNKFTSTEKQQTKKEWDIIVSEKPKNDASADFYGVDKTVYGTSYNNLNTYITPLLASLTTTSDIVGTTFRNNFKTYYDARTDLLNAIARKAKELADKAQNSIDNLQIGGRNLCEMTNRGKEGWGFITGNGSGKTEGITAMGVEAVKVTCTNIGTMYNVILRSFLSNLVLNNENYTLSFDVMCDKNTTFTIHLLRADGTFYLGSFGAINLTANEWIHIDLTTRTNDQKERGQYIYFTDIKEPFTALFANMKLEKGNKATNWTPAPEDVQADIDAADTAAKNAQISANTANNAIADIASDNKLTPVEKSSERTRWNEVSNEKAGINAQAVKYELTSENTSYNNSFQSLANYLNGGANWTTGVPSWLSDAQLSITTAIVGSTYRSNWNGYFTARQNLLNAIYSKANDIGKNAQSLADKAAQRLDNWASDSVISPPEKKGVKDEITRIDADKNEITDGYNKYSLGTPTAYNTAHANYRAILVALSASTPENTTIPSDLATKQTVYYNERYISLSLISSKPKDNLESYKTYVEGKFIATNTKIEGVVTSTTEYTDGKINNLQIGGRNLILNTKSTPVKDYWTYSGWSNKPVVYDDIEKALIFQAYNGWQKSNCIIPITPKGIISFEVKNKDNMNAVPLYISSSDDKGDYLVGVSNQWTKISIKKDFSSGIFGLVVRGVDSSNINYQVYVRNLKLESGDKATDWTPAPEDTQSLIDGIQIGGVNLLYDTEDYWEIGSIAESSPVGSYWESVKYSSINSIRLKNPLYLGKLTNIACKVYNIDYQMALIQFDTNQRYLGITTFVTWTNEKIISLDSSTRYIIVVLSYKERKPIYPNEIRNTLTKIEAGNRYSDWTPCISSIVKESGFTTTAEGNRLYASKTNFDGNGTPLDTYLSNIEQTASELKLGVSETKNRLTTAEGRITVNANAITSKVSQSEFNELGRTVSQHSTQIEQTSKDILIVAKDSSYAGRANVALGTSPLMDYWVLSNIVNNCFEGFCTKINLKDFKIGDDINISFDYEYLNLIIGTVSGNQSIYIQGQGDVEAWSEGSMQGESILKYININLSNSGKVHVSYTFKITSNHKKNNYWIPNVRHDYFTGKARVLNFKAEKGRTETEWNYAPEEINKRIENSEASIKVNAQEIALRITPERATEIANEQIKERWSGGANLLSDTNKSSNRWAYRNGLSGSGLTYVDMVGVTTLKYYQGNSAQPSSSYLGYAFLGDITKFKKGNPKTVSFDIFSENAELNISITMGSYSITGDTNLANGDIKNIPTIPTNKWARVIVTFDITSMDDISYDSRQILKIYGLKNYNTVVYIQNLKIEEGYNATGWQPAIADFEATGISITQSDIRVTAAKFKVQDNLGTPIAVFTTNAAGKPILRAENIDVDNLKVKQLDGATGTFSKLSTTDNRSSIYLGSGALTYQSSLHSFIGGLSIDGNNNINGSLDFSLIKNGIANKLNAPNINCQQFGARICNVLNINNGNRALYFTNKYTTIDSDSVARTMAYSIINGDDVYKIQLYIDDSISAANKFAVNTIILTNNVNTTYYYVFDDSDSDLLGYYGQKVTIINSVIGSKPYIYINGMPVLIGGGQAVTLFNVGANKMYPKLATNIIGAGWVKISQYSNTWS